MKRHLLTMTLLAVFAIRSATAQTQFTGWVATFQNYKLNKHFGLYFDGQWRSTAQVQQMHSLLLRPGLNYYIKPSMTATAGYGFIPQQRTSAGVVGYLPEHRIWEQFLFTHSIKAKHSERATLVQHRFRLEQRFIPKFHAEGDKLARDGHANANRFRYFTRAVIPIGGKRHEASPESTQPPHLAQTSSAPRPFTQGLFLSLQNEIFLNLGDKSPVNGKTFDQNRAYVAFGYRCSKQFDVEMGYMNQYISGAGSNSTNNHILQVATYVRL